MTNQLKKTLSTRRNEAGVIPLFLLGAIVVTSFAGLFATNNAVNYAKVHGAYAKAVPVQLGQARDIPVNN